MSERQAGAIIRTLKRKPPEQWHLSAQEIMTLINRIEDRDQELTRFKYVTSGVVADLEQIHSVLRSSIREGGNGPDDFQDMEYAIREGEPLVAALIKALQASTEETKGTPQSVTDIASRRPHEQGWVTCGTCKHRWVAVRPEGIQPMECPRCHRMGGRRDKRRTER